MSVFRNSQEELENLEVEDIHQEERITKPSALRAINTKFCDDDIDTADNRAAIQELLDFVPPYDQADLETRGMAERFNVNYGLATAHRNEALGPFIDIFTSPNRLVKIVLHKEVDPHMSGTWADIMSDEFTKMIRAWDVSMANMLQLVDVFVSHGIGIPWFEDKASLNWNVGSLEDCKFDVDAVAVPSKVELMTINRTMSIPELFAKIENHEDEEDWNGWNGPEAVRLIERAKPKNDAEHWNFEEAARLIKSCRAGNAHNLPSIDLVWGVVREIDGSISVYATTRNITAGADNSGAPGAVGEKWLYRKRKAYDDANQMFQIFAFNVGNRNRIYTIRGLGYALFQPGQADNILRCKMMDSARHRASEQYQAESSVDSPEDLQFIDLGHAMIVPPGLRGLQQFNSQKIDENIGYVLQSNQQILNRHSSGLASNSIADNPNARRNELQVTAELEHNNRIQGFAISLFYGPYDKHMRELVRRAFTETQPDIMLAKMVDRMKDACEARDVPREMFNKIDLEATQATRLQGAGSKGSRLVGFQQIGEMYSSMDAQGQEFFSYDMASEIKGSEAAERYFGKPGERRGHVDIALARSENNDLLEGVMIDPVDGENRMVHLEEHIVALVDGIQEVNEGQEDLAEWTMRNIPLYRHCVDTLEQTNVHPSLMSQLDSYRQQIQQAGEIIDNGLRHINKLREEQGDMSQGLDPEGNALPEQDPEAVQKATAAQQDNDLKMAKMVAEAQAKIEMMRVTNEAKMDIERQKAMANIALKDAETAAKIKRENILHRALGRN